MSYLFTIDSLISLITLALLETDTAKLFIQKGSRMNDEPDADDNTPF